jgi:hypothetical protein
MVQSIAAAIDRISVIEFAHKRWFRILPRALNQVRHLEDYNSCTSGRTRLSRWTTWRTPRGSTCALIVLKLRSSSSAAPKNISTYMAHTGTDVHSEPLGKRSSTLRFGLINNAVPFSLAARGTNSTIDTATPTRMANSTPSPAPTMPWSTRARRRSETLEVHSGSARSRSGAKAVTSRRPASDALGI